ncbi:hypothetical protein GCM10028783_43130 [Modestobacter muralis]
MDQARTSKLPPRPFPPELMEAAGADWTTGAGAEGGVGATTGNVGRAPQLTEPMVMSCSCSARSPISWP